MYILLFGVAIVFSITNIVNKMFGCTKLGFKGISNQIIGIWIFFRSIIYLIILYCYNIVPYKFLPHYWYGIYELFQQHGCCCILIIHVFVICNEPPLTDNSFSIYFISCNSLTDGNPVCRGVIEVNLQSWLTNEDLNTPSSIYWMFY